MKNKTCGECRFHHQDYHYCEADKECKSVYPENPACDDFEPPKKPTNGDKIRAMSDEELTEKFIYTRREQNGDKCYLSTIRVGKWSSRAEAKAATIEELKKEVEDE